MTTKNLLEYYSAIKAEVGQMEHEIADLCAQPMDHFGADCVLGSPAREPYANMPMPIAGYVQSAEVVAERKKLVKQYDKRLRDLYFWQNKAEEILAQITDVEVRVILRYRYIDGFGWDAIADKLDDGSTMDSVRKRAERALKKSL